MAIIPILLTMAATLLSGDTGSQPSQSEEPFRQDIHDVIENRAAQPLAAVRISAEQRDNGVFAILTPLTDGVRGVAIFGEPSHSLLALVTDNTAPFSVQETTWYQRDIAPALMDTTATVAIPLSQKNSVAAFTTFMIDPSEEEFSVSVLVDRIPGEENNAWTARVRARVPFDLSVAYNTRVSYTVTCGDPGHPCGSSVSCSTQKTGGMYGTCCLQPGHYEGCGWCAKARAYCGLYFCSGC